MESNASTVFYDELHDELLFDILLRLPVKSLLRFMCVSKSWKSLISSPEFMKTHLKASSNARDPARRKLIFSIPCPSSHDYLTECSLSSVLYSPMAEATTMIPGPFFQATNIQSTTEKSIEILGSCNGLVCVAVRRLIRHWVPLNSIDYMRLFLWNPSIRKYRRLPNCGLGFEQYSGIVGYGFGYDGLHDDYKVFVHLSNNLPYDLERKVVGIYSHRKASWKRNEDFQKHLSLNEWSLPATHIGHCVNGKLYWAASSSSRDDHKIVSFDLANETCGDIDLPENMRKARSRRWDIGVLGEGSLAVRGYKYWEHPEVQIWISSGCEVGQSWTKMFVFPNPEDPGRGLPFVIQWNIRLQPVSLLDGNGLLLMLGQRLMLYNPEDGSCKHLDINYNLPHVAGDLRVDMIAETLVLLDGHDG